ncbi:MAG: glycosyltransferase family 2 protein [Urechidicola sp.]|nr:glycosyltransferase family 2 protein [Urechidicola sp.]
MEEALITVIIPAYNSEKFIRRAIDSVLNQLYKNIEIIVIDDGSTDNTAKIIKSYADKVKYIYQENKGVASARNKGIINSNGTYIAFLDADDYVLPNMYKQLIENAHKSNADIVCCNFYQENDLGLRKIAFKKINQNLDLSKSNDLVFAAKHIGNSCWNKLFKRSLIQNLKFPKIKRGEDSLFVLESLLNAKRVVFISNALYVYYQNSLSVTRSNIDISVIENHIYTLNEKKRLVKEYHFQTLLNKGLEKYFYKYFLIFSKAIIRVKDNELREEFWNVWLKENRNNFLKESSLKYISLISTNIKWVYFAGMIFSGRFYFVVKDRINNLKYYFNK